MLNPMRRQKRQGFIIHLMLLAVLLAPLQGVASVYSNMRVGDTHMASMGDADGHPCQYDDRMQPQLVADHCQQHDIQCNQHCDHCGHCQFFPSTPFVLNLVYQNRIDRGTDIAFVSHIPQTDVRPPRLS
jgi:hypothetical protein